MFNRKPRLETNPSTRSLTERARQAATAAGFGAWEQSLRVNGHVDGMELLNGSMLVFFAPWVFIAMGIFLPGPEGSWGDRALCIGFGVFFLCFGVVLFPKAWRRRQAGEALIHLFGSGAVLERAKEEVFALPYANTPVDHVTWQEAIEGGHRPRTHFWITLPDGESVMLDAWREWECADISSLAERWGLSPDPRFLEKEPKKPPLW